ncbi:MAG: ligand-binding sensor domain-containing protein, partial [Flavipsychrobacter sp.]
MYKQAGYLLLVMLFSYKAAFTQQFDLLNYTTDNGLPSNVVYNIFRDHNGLLWFGTDKGVASYNGHEFTIYTTFNGLADNEIFFFQEDPFYRIWMSTFNAKLSHYKNGKFYEAENTPYLGLPIHASATSFIILEDDSSVSMTFLHYPIIVNILKNHVTIIDLHKLSSFFQCNGIISVKKIKENNYRVYTPDAIAIVDTNAQLISLNNYRDQHHYIYNINQNQEYFLDSNIIYSKNFKKLFTANNIHFITKEVCIYYDGKDFYIGTTNGLLINNKWKLLCNNKITSITQDLNGNYWIGTMGNGAYMLSKDYTHTARYDNCYQGKVNYASTNNGNLYYASTNNTLYRFNNGNHYNLFQFPSLYAVNTPYDIQANYLQGKDYYAFRGRNLFVFHHINDLQPKVVKYKTEITDQIKNIHYNSNNFYLTTSNDILKLPFEESTLSRHLFYKRLVNRRWPRLYSMGVENNQHLLYSTIDSVYTVDTSGVITYERHLGIHPFKWGRIMGNHMICCTNKNELLIGTYTSKGIIDTIIQQPYVWNEAYQLDSCHLMLASNNLYHLLTLYPSHNKPKVQLQVLEYPFIPLSAEYITADDESVYFFKNGSITILNKTALFQPAAPPEVYFTLLKTRDSIYTADTVIKLSYKNSRHIAVQFDVISFEGKQFTYEYSISKNGGDTWHTIIGNEINLVAPVFGNYTVKLRARSVSSVYSRTASFRLIINKPFWASWWFIILISFGMLLLFFTFAYYIFNRALKRKQQAHEAELKFLKSEYKAAN